MEMSLKKKFIGDRSFYKKLLAIAVPIMVQNGISNFVNMLDNIMVGQTGTEQMSGVAIVNQLLFVYYLCMFGGLAGAGIFTAQYYGIKDYEGVRTTFRYKFWLGIIIVTSAILLFILHGEALIHNYLLGSSDGGDLQLALSSGKSYLMIMLIGLVPNMLLQVYAGVLRECGETVIPMKAGITAVLVNLGLNYVLIYGHFGFPAMGVRGAAIATVISRFVELIIVLLWTKLHRERCEYLTGVFRTLKVPFDLVIKFFVTGAPLMVNETLWSAGVAVLTQSYSTRGMNVIAAQNISNTISNVFNVVFFAMGDAIAIIVGQLLGAGKMKEARDTDNKIIAFAVFVGVLVGITVAITAPFFPMIYKTTDEAKHLATCFILCQAIFTPQMAFLHTTYFTLRSGGKTWITFIFDSVFMWVMSVPAAYILCQKTSISVIWVFCIIQILDWIKCIVGFVLVKNGIWMQNIVSKEKKILKYEKK